MKVLPVSMSMIASAISVTDLLSIPAEIYMHGAQFWAMVLALSIMGLFMYYIYLPIVYKLNLKSAYEYLEIRFDKKVRWLVMFSYFLLPGLFFMALFIYAPALAFNQVSGFSMYLIVPIIVSICVFYTTTGGLKAVVWTDTLQFSITLCTLAFTLIMGVVSEGGFGEIWRKSEAGNRIEFFEINPDPTARSTFWNVFIGHIIFWGAQATAYPSLMQRFVSLPTLEDSRRALVIFITGCIVTRSFICYSGLIIYARYFDCDPYSLGYVQKVDQLLPYYTMDVANSIPGLSVLFVAGLISTGLSVLSTALNVFSCSLYIDIISPFMPISISERKGNSIMKIITFVLGVFGICMVFVIDKFGSIFEIIYTLLGATAGPALAVFIMEMMLPFINTKAAFSGAIISLAFMSWFTIKKQIYVWNGAIRYEPKALFTDGCNTSVPILNRTIDSETVAPEQPPWLFRISFHYYYLMGFLLTMTIGIIVSWITKNIKMPTTTNPDLLLAATKFLPTSTPTTVCTTVETTL